MMTWSRYLAVLFIGFIIVSMALIIQMSNRADVISIEVNNILQQDLEKDPPLLQTSTQETHTTSSSPNKLQRHLNNETQKQRQDNLKRFCDGYKQREKALKYLSYDTNFMMSDKREVVYCHVPKVACTTWTKIMGYFMGYLQSPWESVEIVKLYTFKWQYVHEVVNNTKDFNRIKSQYQSFMFSRHPYDRLFSAYRNKFLNPLNSGYLKHYGPMIISQDISPLGPHPTRAKDGLYAITFEQFIRFALKAGPDFDDHWRPQTRICHVCDFPFSYLGKFETLREDADMIFVNLNETLRFPVRSEYKEKTVDMLKEYYGKLPKNMLKQIYAFYKDDFEAFGYDPNIYFT